MNKVLITLKTRFVFLFLIVIVTTLSIGLVNIQTSKRFNEEFDILSNLALTQERLLKQYNKEPLLKSVDSVSKTPGSNGMQRVSGLIKNTLYINIFLISTTILLLLFAFIILVNRVFSPIKKLKAEMLALKNGYPNISGGLDKKDEVGQLSDSFNEMSDNLQKIGEKLYEMATHDGLTNLYNHVTFKKLLNEEINRAKRYDGVVSVLMLDIDYFKDINDTFGHQKGDEVLVRIAKLIKSELRSIDKAARYGGEEITIILPDTETVKAEMLAERIRKSINDYDFQVGEKIIFSKEKLQVSVSIGIATFPVDALNCDELVAVADKALYMAKNAGRNRVQKNISNNSGIYHMTTKRNKTGN